MVAYVAEQDRKAQEMPVRKLLAADDRTLMHRDPSTGVFYDFTAVRQAL